MQPVWWEVVALNEEGEGAGYECKTRGPKLTRVEFPL